MCAPQKWRVVDSSCPTGSRVTHNFETGSGTAPHKSLAGNMTTPFTAADVLQRASNKELVESDIEAVGKYVRGDLFPRTVFLFDNNALNEGGVLHKDFLKNCPSFIANGALADPTQNDGVVRQYLNILWLKMSKEGRCKGWLSGKRSNAHQAMQNAFQSELFVQRIVDGSTIHVRLAFLAAEVLTVVVCMILHQPLTPCLLLRFTMTQGC